jgi:signal transduction protein with GAF and PtsI domain
MAESSLQPTLVSEIEGRLQAEGTSDATLHAILDQLLASFGCAAGTIHSMDAETGMLRLRAQRGIPDAIVGRVQVVPIGKGMAGIAAQRRQPVQVCNLQTDASGVAQPAARETRMEGSIAVPMLVADQLHGVLGVAKPVAYDFNAAETDLLLAVAAAMGRALGASGPRA